MSQLIKYEAACRALAECKSVDEVMAIREDAIATEFVHRYSKKLSERIDAAEVVIRAERRLGQILLEAAQ